MYEDQVHFANEVKTQSNDYLTFQATSLQHPFLNLVLIKRKKTAVAGDSGHSPVLRKRIGDLDPWLMLERVRLTSGTW